MTHARTVRRNKHGRKGVKVSMENHTRRLAYERQQGFKPLSTEGTVPELRKRLNEAGIQTPKNSKRDYLLGLISGWNESHAPKLSAKQERRIRKKFAAR